MSTLTEERIKELWSGENNTRPILGVNKVLAFARAIEAECRVPEGYVPVPVEPSDSQLYVAVSFALNVRICSDYNWSAYMRDVYARMLAAAPKPDPERKHEIVPTLAEPSEYAKAFQDMITHGCSFMKDGMRIPPEDVIEPAEPDCECGAVASEHCPACEPVAQEPAEWECFEDTSYYNMWAVRPVGEMQWGKCFHLANNAEAETLCAVLNMQPDKSAEVEKWKDELRVERNWSGQQRERIAELEAIIEAQRTLYANASKIANESDELRRQQAVLVEALEENGESWDDVEANTMTEEEMVKEFDAGYGGTEGCPFTVWTKSKVYFPICYDGAEWVGSVSRHPDGKPTEHQGGG